MNIYKNCAICSNLRQRIARISWSTIFITWTLLCLLLVLGYILSLIF